MAFCVINCRYRHSVWIGYARLSPERVVAVRRLVAERVDGLGDAALRVVDDLRAVAASVGLRGLASERVVFVGGGDARRGARGDRQAAADDGLGVARGVGRIGRPGRRVRGAVEVGARDGRVAARVDGSVLRNKAVTQPGEAGAGEAHKRQLGGAVLARLPRRGLAPPVAVKRDIPRVVRDDAVRVAPVDLIVAVHVLYGQVPFTKGIIAKIGGGERRKLRGLRGLRRLGIGASGDELVRGVVLVGGDEECAAEAGAGLADGATECVFVAATPARRGEPRREPRGLSPKPLIQNLAKSQGFRKVLVSILFVFSVTIRSVPADGPTERKR